MSTTYAWQEDGVIGGHATYCADPSHSLLYYCRADLDERGRPVMKSDAYKDDHADNDATAERGAA